MDFWETLKVSTSASLWLSWIAMLIAAVLTFAIACSSRIHRRYCSLSGILGGVAGEFCAVNSLFIGMCFGVVVKTPATRRGVTSLSFISFHWGRAPAAFSHHASQQ